MTLRSHRREVKKKREVKKARSKKKREVKKARSKKKDKE